MQAGLPRRSAIFVVADDDSAAGSGREELLASGIAVGATGVYGLPAQSAEFVGVLAASCDVAVERGSGPVVCVLGGRGGAGASVFSAALALSSGSALLVDLDIWGGGIDLLVGAEAVPGLRWPEIAVRSGRLDWPAVRDALPNHRGMSVISGTRQPYELTIPAVEAIVDAGRRGGVTVVCDLPRRLCDVMRTAVSAADLVVLVAGCDVRSAAAAAATARVVTALNPNAGLVVRGPAPGGLRAADVAASVGLPVLAAMRPEPLIAERLERGGLRLGRRSPLAAAANEVLDVLGTHPATRVRGAA